MPLKLDDSLIKAAIDWYLSGCRKQLLSFGQSFLSISFSNCISDGASDDLLAMVLFFGVDN